MSRIAVNKLANRLMTKEVNVDVVVDKLASKLTPNAAAPTVRVDGSALVEGDTYFDTVKQAIMQRTTTGWVKTVTVSDIVDVLSSTDATKVLSAKQGKALSDAIAGVISNTYTKAEANSMAMPIGLTFPWTLNEASIPAGSLPRNGQLVSRAVWPQLWALVSSQAISDATWLAAPYTSRGMYSTGDGSTTFRMPDDNAKHVDGNTIAAVTYRGYGKNSAGTPGTHQQDQLQGHWHEIRRASGASTIRLAATSGTGTSSTFDDSNLSNADRYISKDIISDGVNGTTRLGSETRMTNSTVIWVTVGANATVNSGTVDVTALATQVNSVASQVTNDLSKLNGVETGFITVTAGTLATVTYSLATKPNSFDLTIKATAANNGFSIGDEVPIHNLFDYAGGTTSYGVQIQEVTNAGLKLWIGQSLAAGVANKTTGVIFAPLPTQWQLNIRAKIRG